KTHEPTDDELLEFMRPSSRQTFENPESAPRDTARIRQGAKRLWRAAQKSATDSSQSPPRTPPKKYRPSPEQIKQLCRSLNLSEAQAWAFLESETRDAKDMLAYLEYEGGQVPPDDSPGEGEFRDIQPSQISPDKKPP